MQQKQVDEGFGWGRVVCPLLYMDVQATRCSAMCNQLLDSACCQPLPRFVPGSRVRLFHVSLICHLALDSKWSRSFTQSAKDGMTGSTTKARWCLVGWEIAIEAAGV